MRSKTYLNQTRGLAEVVREPRDLRRWALGTVVFATILEDFAVDVTGAIVNLISVASN